MEWGIDIFFYGGTSLYVLAAVMAVLYLQGGNQRTLGWTTGLTAAGALCLAAVLGMRWAVFHRVPLTTPADSINLMVLLCTAIMIPMERKEPLRPLICFYLHPLALLCVVTALVAHRDLHSEPRELRSSMLALHVGMAFLAYALFFMASMTSLAYISKARHLKRHRTNGLLHRLPSLEQMDHILYRLIRVGYPLFGITLVVGLVWTHTDRALLGSHWYLAPKVLLSLVMAAFFSMAFHGRRKGILRGPKLANFVFVGFSIFLAAYVVMALLHLREYNFWGPAA